MQSTIPLTLEKVRYAGGEELPIWEQKSRLRPEPLPMAMASMAGQRNPCSNWHCKDLIDEIAEIFGYDRTNLGLVHLDLSFSHGIDTGVAQPVSQAPYRHSHQEPLIVQEPLDDLLMQACVSPAEVTHMTDNDLGFCIDHRQLIRYSSGSAFAPNH